MAVGTDNDLSDIAVKDAPASPARSLSQSYDLSDIAAGPITNAEQQADWRHSNVKLENTDLSDIAVDGKYLPIPKAYTATTEGYNFSTDRPWDGMRQALAEHPDDENLKKTITPDVLQKAERTQITRVALTDAAKGNDQVAQAMLNGAGKGGAFLAGYKVGTLGGATIGKFVGGGIGALAGGGPEDLPAVAAGTRIGAPIGSVLGGLTTGSLAAWAASKGMNKLAEHDESVRSLLASSELHPIADAAGNLIAFSTSVPKSIANLAGLYREGGALKVVAQLAKGAAGGAVFDRVVRPGFDIASHLVADQLGIPHEQFQSPTLSSLAQNIGLGILTAGHSLSTREFSGDQMVNLSLRAKSREAAGVPLDADDPATVIQGFQKLGVPEDAELQSNGLLKPLSPAEIDIYNELSRQMQTLKQSGALDLSQIASLSGRQTFVPTFGRKPTVLTRVILGLKPREAPPEQLRIGGPDADSEQSPMEEVRSQPTRPAAQVPTGQPGAVQQPARTGQGQGPIASTPASATPAASPQAVVTPVVPPVQPQPTGVVPTPPVAPPATPAPIPSKPVVPPPQLITESSVEKMPPDQLAKLRHDDGIRYGLTLGQSDVPRLQAKYDAATEAMPQAFASNDPAAQLSSFGILNFYGGALMGATRGQHPISGSNYDLYVAKHGAPPQSAPPTPQLAKPTIAPDKHYLFDTKAGDVAPMKDGGNIFIVGHFDKLKEANAAADKLRSAGASPAVTPWIGKPARKSAKPVRKYSVLLRNVSQSFVDTINAKRAAETKTKKSETLTPKSETKQTQIGTNSMGHPLFEDANGIRSYVENGVRVTEPVRMIPTRQGVRAAPREQRPAEFEVATESEAKPAVPETLDDLLPEGSALGHFTSRGDYQTPPMTPEALTEFTAKAKAIGWGVGAMSISVTYPNGTISRVFRKEATSLALSFHDAGYADEPTFRRDYDEQAAKDVGETEQEFIMRKHCSGLVTA